MRRLVEQELAKVGADQSGARQRDSQAKKSLPEDPSSEKSISKLIQRALADARDKREISDSGGSYRVHKSRRRHRHRRRCSSDSSSTDSEDGGRPKVSFLHQEKGTQDQAMTDLASHFPTVVLKYFKQIYYGTFQPSNLAKLGQGMADKMTGEDTTAEVKGIGHLNHCMEVYGQINLQFAHPSKLRPLQLALAKYRIRQMRVRLSPRPQATPTTSPWATESQG